MPNYRSSLAAWAKKINIKGTYISGKLILVSE
jgi:hypothetical protein